jgi:hypothetical protein
MAAGFHPITKTDDHEGLAGCGESGIHVAFAQDIQQVAS